MKKYSTLLLCLLFLSTLVFSLPLHGEEDDYNLSTPDFSDGAFEDDDDDSYEEELEEEDQDIPEIWDPFEPFNRTMFKVSDTLNTILLKPTAILWKTITPPAFRVGLRKAFTNLQFPIRFTNSVLQGKIKNSLNEITRFSINTTIGLVGFYDPATSYWNIPKSDEDLGQTFGFYGIGHGPYLFLPFAGGSSIRDLIGSIGDGYLEPSPYLGEPERYYYRGIELLNNWSFFMDDYDQLKKSAMDPYVALRNFYVQRRKKQVEK